METILSKQEFQDLVESFWEIVQLTESLQRDISYAMVTNEAARKMLSKQLSLSEEKMQGIMNDAVRTFISAMPLASMNRANLFTQAMAMHAEVTGDPLMHAIFSELNQRALSMN